MRARGLGIVEPMWYLEPMNRERVVVEVHSEPGGTLPTHLACSLSACCPGRWNFGDGQQLLRQFKPPYDESFQVPDPTVAQVLVEHNTTHIYTTPGEGWGYCLSCPELGQPTFGHPHIEDWGLTELVPQASI